MPPYIPAGKRRESTIRHPRDVGELNFAFTRISLDYLDGAGTPEIRYARFNDIIGALECAKLELYRRRVAPYEDAAIEKNGDLP